MEAPINNEVQRVQKKEESTLAIVSVVCGGLGFFFGFFTAIPAIICGHMALSDLNKNPDKYDSSAKTMSIVGLVLGYLILSITLLFVLVMVVVATAAW